MRHLDWRGTWNARDLGGLRTTDGHVVRPGALVRCEAPVLLDRRGWSQVERHGIRTVVDLRSTPEVGTSPVAVPAGLEAVHVPLEDGLEADPHLARWGASGWLSTPLYLPGFVARWPERCARALTAVARARPGGVLVHCAKGRDRTGLVVALLLQACAVPVEDVVADHAATWRRLAADRARALGAEDDARPAQRVLDREGAGSPAEAVRRVLVGHDLLALVRAGGLDAEDEQALRDRLTRPA